MTNSIDNFSLLGVQKTLDRMERKPRPATGINVDTTAFNNNLTAADDTVQKALETIDDLVIPGGINELGTTSDTFQLNDAAGGPTLKDEGTGALSVRDDTDAMYVDVTAAQFHDGSGNTFTGASTTSDSFSLNDGAAPLADAEVVLTRDGGANPIGITYDNATDTVYLTRNSALENGEIAIHADLESNGISVNAAGFSGNLTPADDTVQKALDRIDGMVIAGGSSIYDDLITRTVTLGDAAWNDVGAVYLMDASKGHTFTIEAAIRKVGTKEAAFATYKLGVITDAVGASFIGQDATDTESIMSVVAIDDGDEGGAEIGFELKAVISAASLNIQWQARSTMWVALESIVVRLRIGVVKDS